MWAQFLHGQSISFHCKHGNYSPVSVDKGTLLTLYADDISLSFLCSSVKIKFAVPAGLGKRLQHKCIFWVLWRIVPLFTEVSANLADHWLIHLFMEEENEKPDFFYWIGIVKLALHFPPRKWGWGWCCRLNWKEGMLMLGNKRKWNSKFVLFFICVTYLFSFQKLFYSD